MPNVPLIAEKNSKPKKLKKKAKQVVRASKTHTSVSKDPVRKGFCLCFTKVFGFVCFIISSRTLETFLRYK